MNGSNDNDTPPRPPSGQQPPKPAPNRALFVWFGLLAIVLLAWQLASFRAGDDRREVSYSTFLGLLDNGEVESLEVASGGNGTTLEGRLKQRAATGDAMPFRAVGPVTDDLLARLEKAGVEVTFKNSNSILWSILGQGASLLLFFALLYFLFYRRMGGGANGAFSFGKSRARLMNHDARRVTFKDVAGVDEAREEVQEIVDFLKDPKKFQRLGGRIPKGVLLVGPPGTGKTLLARAIAGEAEVPFFSISGSDFVEMFVGVGASRVRDMFEQGKKSAPCIIFIDEIDAVGRSRFSGIGGGHDEREQTLNALLVEMDGFDAQEGIIIIAATNRPDVLDPALLRPGRFDRQIVVDLPTLKGREDILKIHARKVKLAPEVSLQKTARGTPGFSGADLANLVNEAALIASRRNADAIAQRDLEEARDKVCWGRERKSHVLDEKEKRHTAVHEVGHAVVIALTPDVEPLHKVTIIPRGRALGATFQLPEKDRYTVTRSSLVGDLAGAMGGRAAEELVFGEISTGASQDIRQATNTARRMVTEWGMSERLGPQFFGDREELLFLGREVNRSNDISEETARVIDEEVKRLIDDAHSTALSLLASHRPQLDQIVELLLEKETLDGRDVIDILRHGRVLTDAERDAEDQEKKDSPDPLDPKLPPSPLVPPAPPVVPVEPVENPVPPAPQPPELPHD